MERSMKRKKIGASTGPHYSGGQVCSSILGKQIIYHKQTLTQINEAPLTTDSDLQSSHKLHDALHSAQQKLNAALFAAIDRKHIPQIARLLQQGADCNAVRDGLSPIHIAVAQENPELVAFLLTHGASLDKTGPYGNTPLHEAALKSNEKKLNIIEILIIGGANVNKQNELGQTPLHFHKSNEPETYKKLAALLLRAGAQLHLTDIKGNAPFDTLEPSLRDELVALALRCRFDR